jgi:quinol monooxygenase YgiN
MLFYKGGAAMTEQKVSVIAQFKAQTGKEAVLKKELIDLIGLSRPEPGCITYVLHQSMEDKTCFMFYENWVNKKDLDEHLKKPYIKTFMEKAGKLLADPVKINLWEMIG